jgi:hypothetical protein
VSLTSFLKIRKVSERFKAEFIMPSLGSKRELRAPLLSTNHSSLVGTAFDYLLRFYVKRLNPKSKTRDWIAQKAAKIIVEIDDCPISPSEIVANAKKVYRRYLQTGKIDDKLLRAVLCLAKLDPIFRSPFFFLSPAQDSYFETLGNIDSQDIQDLRQLISLVQPQAFTTKGVCSLNPFFGCASKLVGGADCDLVIDDILLEIKTVQKFELKREYFNQLIGYYVLSRIGGISGMLQNHRINRLGIYFSRHGYLWLFRVDTVLNEKKLPEFIRWFKQQAKSLS